MIDFNKLGVVVAGSLGEGVKVRLNSTSSVEGIKVGSNVVIQGRENRFFGVVTDIALESSDPSLQFNLPDVSDKFIRDTLSGTSAYGAITVEPMLTIGIDQQSDSTGPRPAKTIPSHFSEVLEATEEDINSVFGSEADGGFWIGSPLDMEAKLCLNLDEMVKRSNGVFGKSGTGKTFLTRLLLIGILQSGKASNLIFDMHNEYGWKGTSESNYDVKGLKQLFSSKVSVFSMDSASAERRGFVPDHVVSFGYSDIAPEDIQLLRETLDLTSIAADAAYSLEAHFGPSRWFSAFIGLSSEATNELASEINVNGSALAALRRRLERLTRFDFVSKDRVEDSAEMILQRLNAGQHVVLEFGKHGNNPTAYMLVANILTRRIYDRYQRQKELAMGDKLAEPPNLVITIEEAHRFLSTSMSGQTIFGTIAREMRKYNVTLLVVDQRPSDIDEEVMSQIGTKVSCLLDSGRDIDSVLSGVSGNRKLRGVLARLESRQQALIFGHSVPMPVVVRTRDYGSAQSYSDLGDIAASNGDPKKALEDLFGPS
ncbi:MAG TPA: ATP-binding protein [Dehalococcoidia bacterium]|nr:ATP-binding protein [Dehalococcoidia bacterium]